MVDDYINRKAGRSEVKYELPALEPILADTYGVIAYQEQVMRMASVLAGFTMGQSDVLRKAMGKKDPKVMAKQREAFMSGALRQGRQREEGQQDLRADGVLRRATASTSRTRPRMRSWRIRPRISRRTIRGTSPRRC